MNIFRKKESKEIIKQWLIAIDKENDILESIVALNFGLSQPYMIELTGSAFYDSNNDDWACDEDYVPSIRYCSQLPLNKAEKWNEFLERIKTEITELMSEIPDLKLWQISYITIGFCDGDLFRIK